MARMVPLTTTFGYNSLAKILYIGSKKSNEDETTYTEARLMLDVIDIMSVG